MSKYVEKDTDSVALASTQQVYQLGILIDVLGTNEDQLLKYYDKKSLRYLTYVMALHAITALSEQFNKRFNKNV